MPSSFPSLRIFVPLFLVPLSFSLPRFRHVLLSTSLFSVFRHHPASPSSFFRVFYSPPPTPPQPVTHYVTVFQCSCLSTWLLSLPQCLSFTQPTGGSSYPEVPRSLLSPAMLPGNSVSPSLIPSDRPPALPPSIAISVSLPSSIFPSFCLPPSQPPRVWPLSGLLSLLSSPCLGLAVSQGLFAPPLLSCVWATACRLLGVGSDATSLVTSLSSLLSVPPFPVCAPCLTICLKSCQNYSCPFILDENHILIIFITVK